MTTTLSVYPETAPERDRWITERRGLRVPVSPDRPYAFLVEEERFANGDVGEIATLFLTNRECPWRCAMCDLWQHTLPVSVIPGDIPRQIAFALDRLPRTRQIKLYNSGSFFDSGAIPPQDDETIAALLAPFERVIVESHPSLIGERTLRFRDLLRAPLEVAMGLETAHPEVLLKLNKRMTLEQYKKGAERLRANGIALRSFVLVQPPFMRAEEALEWACQSIDFAQACGASVTTLIPTRGGNGSMEDLARLGQFTSPQITLLEAALEYGLASKSGRVFADLWDADRVPGCAACKGLRVERLRRMNLSQVREASVSCDLCRNRV